MIFRVATLQSKLLLGDSVCNRGPKLHDKTIDMNNAGDTTYNTNSHPTTGQYMYT